MAYDDLLRLTGSAAGAPKQASVTANADGGGGYKYYGPARSGVFVIRYGGRFDRTTGDETIAVAITRASDAAGTGAETAATAPTGALTHAGYVTGSTSRYSEVPSVAPVRVAFSTTAAKPYIKCTFTVAGTTPIGDEITVMLEPGVDALIGSGS